MIVRLLSVGIVFVSFSIIFMLGGWYFSRHKWEDQKAMYLRGYNNGYEARSIDAAKTFAARSVLSGKERESAVKFINREHSTTIDREIISNILRRLL